MTDPEALRTKNTSSPRGAKARKAARGRSAFPNDLRRDTLADELHTRYGAHPSEWSKPQPDMCSPAA
jgi:hypothetical protein